MVKKINNKKIGVIIGAWAFLIGVILAIILGLFSAQLSSLYGIIVGVLVVAGILIGLLNIKSNETSKFLFAALALVVVAYMGDSALSSLDTVIFGSYLRNILYALLILLIPTTIIVSLKVVFELAKK